MLVHDDVIKWKHFPRHRPFVRGIHRFPSQRPVTRSFHIYFDLRLNKRLSKQLWGWWFETPSCPLWRHCNGWTKIWRRVREQYERSGKTFLFVYTGLHVLQGGRMIALMYGDDSIVAIMRWGHHYGYSAPMYRSYWSTVSANTRQRQNLILSPQTWIQYNMPRTSWKTALDVVHTISKLCRSWLMLSSRNSKGWHKHALLARSEALIGEVEVALTHREVITDIEWFVIVAKWSSANLKLNW